MKRQKRAWLILGTLLVLWAWILYGQFGGTSVASADGLATTDAPDPPAAEEPMSAARVLADRPRLHVATPQQIELQRQTADLPVARDPFLAPNSMPVSDPLGDPEPPTEDSDLLLTSTLRTGNQHTAVIDGKRYHLGDDVTGGGVLERIGDGWVDLRGRDGNPIRIRLAKRVNR